MLTVFLIGLFVAFGLAVLEVITDFLSIFITPIVINSTVALLLSALANYLVDTHTVKLFTLNMVAGAFLGRALLATVERVTTYRQVTINPTR